MPKYVHFLTGEVVEALQFTGENRTETRAIVGRTIVIRQGRIFFDTDIYVYTGDWFIKHANGVVMPVKDEMFKKFYELEE